MKVRCTVFSFGLGLRIVNALALTCLLMPSGCATSTGGSGSTGSTGDTTDGTDGEGSAEVTGLQTDRAISGSQDLTIIYVVPTTATSVSAFYVPEDQSSDPAARVTLATNLLPGTSSFTFNTIMIPRGTYRIGLQYVDENGQTQSVLSVGRLIIEGTPSPQFFEPSADTVVESGDSVTIVADLGDPEAEVAWRVFFIAQEGAPDPVTLSGASLAQLGNELETGTGNAVNFDWTTTNVAFGTYLLGISATDTGFTVSETALAGDGIKIVTLYSTFAVEVVEVGSAGGDDPLAPTVVVSAPAGNLSIFGSDTVNVQFVAEIKEGQGNQDDVQVFYDNDSSFANGFSGVLVSGLSTSDTSASFDSNALGSGTFRIGVSVDDGVNNIAAAYAAGSVSVETTPTLEMTKPASGLVVRPSDPVTIEWTTNVPASAAQTIVRALRSGETTPLDITPVGLDGTSFDWTPAVNPGTYSLSVTLVFNDSTIADLTASAAGTVRVSTAPRVLWVGCFGDNPPSVCPAVEEPTGVIFEGIQVEDNLGAAFAEAGDMNGDGSDDILMTARYGKPFFANPGGIGHGEAYLVYGNSQRLGGELNVNSVGTTSLSGVTFAGIRTPEANTVTDGLSDVAAIPDVDGDGSKELVFGFPNVLSRGHNINSGQNGVVNPLSIPTLEREDQFRRGGIVIVSSMNSSIATPSTGNSVMNLDLVGQGFEVTVVGPIVDGMDGETATNLTGNIVSDDDVDRFGGGGDNPGEPFYVDNVAFDPMEGLGSRCSGNCVDSQSGEGVDSNNTFNFGFSRALARDYFSTYVWNAGLIFEPAQPFRVDGQISGCVNTNGFEYAYCLPFPPVCEPTSPGLLGASDALAMTEPTLGRGTQHPVFTRRSGFYPPFSSVTELNEAVEPLGARILGVGKDDQFGSTLTISSVGSGKFGDFGSLIVSAPARTANGILLGPNAGTEPTVDGGEINGLGSSVNVDSGVAYLFDLRSLWTSFRDENDNNQTKYPPKPHQYIVGEASHCGGFLPRIDNVEVTRIAGASSEKIRNIEGIEDFNGDSRDDFAVGTPETARLYIAFRRNPASEGDFVLEKLGLATSDSERLSGALITGAASSEFAASLATGIDLNGDDESDLIVGAPKASASAGEVFVIFSSPDLVTPVNGVDIETLIDQGRAARISGRTDEQGLFGFNVANAGDIDGDGKDDLLVAAPAASPRYDSDGDDTLDSFGLDINGDGTQDDLTGPFGVPDGEQSAEDGLPAAGLVYVIWGSNIVSGNTNISELGSSTLDGAIIVGRRGADFMGGGDAGDVSMGGITGKLDRGRSAGLAAAGDFDNDGMADLLIGSILASPRIDPLTGESTTHGGEAYLIYGFGK